MNISSASIHLKSFTSPQASAVASKPPSGDLQQAFTSWPEVESGGHTPAAGSPHRPDQVANPFSISTTCKTVEGGGGGEVRRREIGGGGMGRGGSRQHLALIVLGELPVSEGWVLRILCWTAGNRVSMRFY